jgi:hypothetical protein
MRSIACALMVVGGLLTQVDDQAARVFYGIWITLWTVATIICVSGGL